MTETERLLIQAREIALRVMGEATEAAVLAVFGQLCVEQDALKEGMTVH